MLKNFFNLVIFAASEGTLVNTSCLIVCSGKSLGCYINILSNSARVKKSIRLIWTLLLLLFLEIVFIFHLATVRFSTFK